MVWAIVKQIWCDSRNPVAVRRKPAADGRRLVTEQSPELLEARNLLSAAAAIIPAAITPAVETPVVLNASPAVPRSNSSHQTIDSPLGPIDLTLHVNGTKVRGIANLNLTPGPTVPDVKLSPIHFKAALKDLKLAGRFSGSFALAALPGPKERFTGTITASPNFLDLTNVPAHITVKVARNEVVNQDFTIPLSTVLSLLQQQA
jgi:hypothetical protein